MDALIPAAALALGFAGALVTEFFRDRAAIRRDRKRRLADFQRQSLIELQDALAQYVRAAGSLATARRRRHTDREEWPAADEFYVHFETLVEARLPVIIYTSRIDDLSLRELVGALQNAEAALATDSTPDDALERQALLHDAYRKALERSGELLRQP